MMMLNPCVLQRRRRPKGYLCFELVMALVVASMSFGLGLGFSFANSLFCR